MNPTPRDPLNLTGEELEIVKELLEAESAKLLLAIHHADRRAFREELRRRLSVVEELEGRCQPARAAAAAG